VSRRGYAVALGLAVAVLVGSMCLALAVFLGGGRGAGPSFDAVDRNGAPGMMGRGNDRADSVTDAEAQRIASDWVAAHVPGAELGAGVSRPMGDVFTVTRDGVLVGRLVVRPDGEVRYRVLRPVGSTPSPSASTTA
jgi:hypothetical protein